MSKQTNIVLLCSLLISAGCTRTLEVGNACIERQRLEYEELQSMSFRDVKWVVVTENNVQEELLNLDEPVLFALTKEEYEDLSINFKMIYNHLYKTKNILEKYKNYYESGRQE